MLKMIMISDSYGLSYFSRSFNEDFPKPEQGLLEGLFSAIEIVGSNLFQKDLATITFGLPPKIHQIVVITKSLRNLDKKIFFIFFLDGKYEKKGANNSKEFEKFATEAFIENKNAFNSSTYNFRGISSKINKLIETKYNTLYSCELLNECKD